MEYEARQDRLYKWNPVGVVPLVVSSVIGTIAALGYMGTFLQNTATFFAAILASILTVIIAIITKGNTTVKVMLQNLCVNNRKQNQ